MTRMLERFGDLTGEGVFYHDQEPGRVLMSDQTCAFCAYSLQHSVTGDYCRYACHGAAMQMLSSGEPHFQRCWAGLLFSAVAVAPRGAYQGGLECGGFIAEGEAGDIADVVKERLQAVPNVDAKPFLRRLSSLREMAPGAIRGLGMLLLETTLSEGINCSRLVRRANEQYQRQRQIAEAYALLEDRDVSPPDVLGDTYQLVSYLHRKDQAGAMQFVSGYLAKLLMISRWNLMRLRAHVRVLLAVMTSQAILDGEDWTSATARELLVMADIEKADRVEDICSLVADRVLEHFGEGNANEPRLRLSDKVITWLQGHFHESARLEDAARAVGASVSSIAHRLPIETGKSYRRLRLDIRIAEAKRLLAETNRSVSDIAESCGFSDQSHLIRLFKEAVNLTPGQFRSMLTIAGPGDAL